MITPKTLPGFMELLPAQQIVFEKIKAKIAQVYERYGFTPLDTPVLELSDILLAKAGGETEKQIYRFTKGDTDMCMRFDLTVPLARYVAQHQNDLAFPFKRYHIGKAYRGERPQSGRFREFYQCDIDVIGSGQLSVVYDAELPAIIYSLFKELGLEDFCIHFNNRLLMKGFFESLGLEENSTDITRLIDKWDKIGADGVRECLKEIISDDEKIDNILSFVQISGTSEEILGSLKGQQIENENYQKGLEELSILVDSLGDLKVPADYFCVDLKIMRGHDYYTGTVYETFVKGHREWGCICGGGRYDNLTGYYTNKVFPGVGMSIGLSRLFDVLNKQGCIPATKQTIADILILPMGIRSYALQVASSLRDEGISTQVLLDDMKFKNKMVYANKVGVPFVLILGEEEEKSQTVTLKNMITGEQKTLKINEIKNEIKQENQQKLIVMKG